MIIALEGLSLSDDATTFEMLPLLKTRVYHFSDVLDTRMPYDQNWVNLYLEDQDNMKQSIGILTDKYIDDSSILREILHIYDRMDSNMTRYMKMLEDGTIQLMINAVNKQKQKSDNRRKKKKEAQQRKFY